MRKFQHFSLLFFLSFCFVALNAQAEEYGKASYYGDEFNGSVTASDEAYDKNKLTAAHKTLPMGTKVRVTRIDNKKSVVVRINDRGPYLKGRIVDLSGKAAEALGMITNGEATTEVKLEVVGAKAPPKKTTSTAATKPTPPKKTSTKPTPAKATPRPTAASTEPTKVATKPKNKPKPAATKPAKEETAKGGAADDNANFKLVTAKDFNEFDLYKIQVLRPEKKGFGVQVASFSDYSNVMKKVAELQGQWFKNILVSVEKGTDGKPIYKLILGPFPDQKTATAYKKAAKKNKKLNGFVVSLADIKAEKK